MALQLTRISITPISSVCNAFSAVGIAALAVLLLGPLPRFEVAFAMKTDADNSQKNSEAPFETPQSISGRRNALIAQFAKMHGLTARETEVLSLIVAGRDVPYIERELVLAKSTVKTHVKHIYTKCGVSSKTGSYRPGSGFRKK